MGFKQLLSITLIRKFLAKIPIMTLDTFRVVYSNYRIRRISFGAIQNNALPMLLL